LRGLRQYLRYVALEVAASSNLPHKGEINSEWSSSKSRGR